MLLEVESIYKTKTFIIYSCCLITLYIKYIKILPMVCNYRKIYNNVSTLPNLLAIVPIYCAWARECKNRFGLWGMVQYSSCCHYFFFVLYKRWISLTLRCITLIIYSNFYISNIQHCLLNHFWIYINIH